MCMADANYHLPLIQPAKRSLSEYGFGVACGSAACALLAPSRPHTRFPPPQQPAVKQARARVLILRQRMLHFVQNLLYFTTCEVIEPNWRGFEEKLTKVCLCAALLFKPFASLVL